LGGLVVQGRIEALTKASTETSLLRLYSSLHLREASSLRLHCWWEVLIYATSRLRKLLLASVKSIWEASRLVWYGRELLRTWIAKGDLLHLRDPSYGWLHKLAAVEACWLWWHLLLHSGPSAITHHALSSRLWLEAAHKLLLLLRESLLVEIVQTLSMRSDTRHLRL
jgi:hypothetical protein